MTSHKPRARNYSYCERKKTCRFVLLTDHVVFSCRESQPPRVMMMMTCCLGPFGHSFMCVLCDRRRRIRPPYHHRTGRTACRRPDSRSALFTYIKTLCLLFPERLRRMSKIVTFQRNIKAFAFIKTIIFLLLNVTRASTC